MIVRRPVREWFDTAGRPAYVGQFLGLPRMTSHPQTRSLHCFLFRNLRQTVERSASLPRQLRLQPETERGRAGAEGGPQCQGLHEVLCKYMVELELEDLSAKGSMKYSVSTWWSWS